MRIEDADQDDKKWRGKMLLFTQLKQLFSVSICKAVFVVLSDKGMEAKSSCSYPQAEIPVVCLSSISRVSFSLCASRRDSHALSSKAIGVVLMLCKSPVQGMTASARHAWNINATLSARTSQFVQYGCVKRACLRGHFPVPETEVSSLKCKEP